MRTVQMTELQSALH